MARVESLKRKMTRLIIAIIVVSVGLVFLLQILLNILEFSNFGKSLYTNFWKQPHYIFSFTSACISICLLYTSPSPRDQRGSRMPSSA